MPLQMMRDAADNLLGAYDSPVRRLKLPDAIYTDAVAALQAARSSEGSTDEAQKLVQALQQSIAAYGTPKAWSQWPTVFGQDALGYARLVLNA